MKFLERLVFIIALPPGMVIFFALFAMSMAVAVVMIPFAAVWFVATGRGGLDLIMKIMGFPIEHMVLFEWLESMQKRKVWQ